MLIHGAAGFVGGALIDQLTGMDIDDLTLTDIRPTDMWRYGAAGPPGVRTTVLTAEKLCDLDLPEVDVAVVLAGQTDVDEGLLHPRRSFAANLDIAIDVAEWLARQPGKTRLIYLSSDETLGESFVPLAEDAELAPTQPYASSKAAAEMILRCYRDTYGLNVTIVRSCNLVGMQIGARKLIPTAVTCLKSGRPVPVYGDGRYLREWMSVEDLCAAIRLIAMTEKPYGTYHCCSGTHLSVKEVIGLVAEGIDHAPRWRHVPDRLVHDRCYAMDASRLRAQGWTPRHEVRDAIRLASKRLAEHDVAAS
jgi:dTDP-glucose 4,6-dehydratase